MTLRRVSGVLWLVRWAACCGVLAVCAGGRADERLETDRGKLYEAYAARLADLGDWCQAMQLAEQARLVRGWLPPRDPGRIYVFVVEDARRVELPQGAEKNLVEWKQRFEELRREQAGALIALARRAAESDRPALAMMLLAESVREAPDAARAWRILGYEEYGGAWRTAFAKTMLERGRVWHERFGWLPKQDVARYEAGERRIGERWIDAAEEARRRRKITDGWRVETDHYLVTTNHSREAGVELARRLERLHQVWRYLFAGYADNGAEFKRAFRHKGLVHRRGKPHQVVYYRTRDEYNAALLRVQPRIAITLGIYLDAQRRAYFFAGEEQDAGTLQHEATHQLFQESRRVTRSVGRENNFWVIEGVAAYFESLTEHDGYITLGGFEAGRMPAARHRLLKDGLYVPLARLTRMGKDELQADPQIAKLYSQSAGLVTFLMHYDDGRYREALVRYLVAVYQGRDDPSTLARLTGRSYEELDGDYRRFLER